MLNKSQKKAVECLKNPCIVIAGPGTGKTALITEKIKFLIEKKTKPEEILALTFTNKAAEEMTQRVQNPEFCAHTFHSFALELIKEYQKHITKIDKNFRIIDDANIQLYFIENLEYFKLQSVELGNNIASTAQDLANTITKIKDFGLTIQDIEKLELESKLKTDLITSYANYEGFKKKKNLIDYADILLYIKDLLEKKPEIKIELQNRYKYILIDEFQDTNKLQFEIIKLLSKKDNITIVGDQKQSIYSFRGSNYENLELFKKHFKNHEEIFLNENYRSSKQVLEVTNKLITNKKELLKPTKIEEGNIELIEACDEQSQIQYLIENLENLKEEKVGILTRTKTDAQKISKKLNEFGIKHILEGATNIFNQNEIKEIIFYIQIALHPKESNAEIFHILSNSGLRKETVRKITRKASLKERSISNVLESEENLSDFKDEQELAKEIREKILYFINLKKTSIPIKQFALEIIEKTNIYKNAIIEDDKQKIQNLNLFLGFIDNYNEVYQISDLDHFLKICNLTKKIDIETTYDENLNSNIEILTIHASKGKEFDHVFIPNLNKRKFPLSNKPSKFEINLNKENHEDEEKRLFFVAVSRAKKELHLSYVKKYIDNKFPSPPSEFLQALKLKSQEYNKKLLTLNLSKREQKEVESINKIVTLLLNSNYELAKTEIDKMKSGFVKKDLISYF
ncbi:MAG: ATP-dependent helicase, partial [Nanoarchaeota archaeon]